MRFYFILVRRATTKKITTTKHVRDVKKEESLSTADRSAIGAAIMEINTEIPQTNLKTESLY